MMDTSTVYPQVRAIVADVLAVDEDEIEPTGSFIEDYGGQSIDLLDLMFQLEREFGVEITRGAIEKHARGDMPDEEFEENGRITEKGLARLKEYLSEVPEERIKEGMLVVEIPTLFTTETICKVVLRAQQEKEAATDSPES